MLSITSEEWNAITLSLQVAILATLCVLPFGVFIAFILARCNFWGKSLLNACVHLPLILPPVVVGYLLLLLFGRNGVIGRSVYENFGLSLAFNWFGAALASGIMGFPLLVRSVQLSIESIDAKLEQAASTLGASPLRVLVTITLPLALPGMLAGAILCFAKALGEFGATITFVSNIPGETQTIASAIYSLIQTPGGDIAVLRLMTVSILIGFATLLISDMFFKRMKAKV